MKVIEAKDQNIHLGYFPTRAFSLNYIHFHPNSLGYLNMTVYSLSLRPDLTNFPTEVKTCITAVISHFAETLGLIGRDIRSRVGY